MLFFGLLFLCCFFCRFFFTRCCDVRRGLCFFGGFLWFCHFSSFRNSKFFALNNLCYSFLGLRCFLECGYFFCSFFNGLFKAEQVVGFKQIIPFQHFLHVADIHTLVVKFRE